MEDIKPDLVELLKESLRDQDMQVLGLGVQLIKELAINEPGLFRDQVQILRETLCDLNEFNSNQENSTDGICHPWI